MRRRYPNLILCSHDFSIGLEYLSSYFLHYIDKTSPLYFLHYCSVKCVWRMSHLCRIGTTKHTNFSHRLRNRYASLRPSKILAHCVPCIFLFNTLNCGDAGHSFSRGVGQAQIAIFQPLTLANCIGLCPEFWKNWKKSEIKVHIIDEEIEMKILDHFVMKYCYTALFV